MNGKIVVNFRIVSSSPQGTNSSFNIEVRKDGFTTQYPLIFSYTIQSYQIFSTPAGTNIIAQSDQLVFEPGDYYLIVNANGAWNSLVLRATRFQFNLDVPVTNTANVNNRVAKLKFTSHGSDTGDVFGSSSANVYKNLFKSSQTYYPARDLIADSGEVGRTKIKDFYDITGPHIFITTPNNFESYMWQDGSTSATFQTSNPQEVSVVVTDINGCIATDTAQMMSFPEIEVNLAPSQTICEGEVYEIIVPDFDSQYYTFLWSDSSISPSLYVQNSGLYSVTVTDSIGCMGFDSIQININPKPKPSVSDADICEGNITTISTGVYESYLWNTGEEKSEIEVGLAGIYTVTVEDAYGCFGSASGVVTVHSKPVIPNLSNQIICEDEQLTLLPSLPEGTYLWKPGGETTSSIQVSEPGTYEAFINSTYGCVDSISIEVSQASNPNINLGSDTNICEGQTLVAGFKSENAIIIAIKKRVIFENSVVIFL